MGDADFRSTCLLCRPFYVGENNERAEVALYLHSEPLQFGNKCCHALDVGYDCLPPIENFPVMFINCCLIFCGLWYFCPLYDGCEELMDMVLVHPFEILYLYFDTILQ